MKKTIEDIARWSVNYTRRSSVFNTKKTEIKRELDEYGVLDIAGSSPRQGNQRYLLSTLEVAVVMLGCVIFVGALVTALCITCVRRSKR